MHVAIALVDRFAALDAVGPYEVVATAGFEAGSRRQGG